MNHPTVVRDVYLNPGQFSFGVNHYRIRTLLGSCIALILWHPERKIGGMSHIILPTRRNDNDTEHNLPGKYADESLLLFEKTAKFYRSIINEYQAKIFGGANILLVNKDSFISQEEKDIIENIPGRFNIGEKNIIFIKDLLNSYGIEIVAEHTGGNKHRKVYFSVWDGEVWMENQKD